MGIYRPGEGKGASRYYRKFELQRGCRKWNWNHPFTFEDPPSNMADFLKQASAWTPSVRQTLFPVAPVLLAVSLPFSRMSAGDLCSTIITSLWYSSLSSCHLYLPVWHQRFLCRSRPDLVMCLFSGRSVDSPFSAYLLLSDSSGGGVGRPTASEKKNVPRHLIALYFILDFTISTSLIREMRIRLHVDIRHLILGTRK